MPQGMAFAAPTTIPNHENVLVKKKVTFLYQNISRCALQNEFKTSQTTDKQLEARCPPVALRAALHFGRRTSSSPDS